MKNDICNISIVHLPCQTVMILESTLNDKDAIFECPSCGERIMTKVMD